MWSLGMQGVSLQYSCDQMESRCPSMFPPWRHLLATSRQGLWHARVPRLWAQAAIVSTKSQSRVLHLQPDYNSRNLWVWKALWLCGLVVVTSKIWPDLGASKTISGQWSRKEQRDSEHLHQVNAEHWKGLQSPVETYHCLLPAMFVLAMEPYWAPSEMGTIVCPRQCALLEAGWIW